jgi:hypothetical protein
VELAMLLKELAVLHPIIVILEGENMYSDTYFYIPTHRKWLGSIHHLKGEQEQHHF